MRVYLCGPINGCSDDEATTWRGWFKENMPEIAFVDPMIRDYRGKESEEYREIVDLDKRDIRGVDVVVVMYVKPSVGTSMEVLFAWTLGIPVVVIDESGKPLSPWMRYHASAVVASKEEAAAKVKVWI
jgi:nucleoside 2-deoxyribosyltransferase